MTQKRICLISGGTRGIGLAVSEKLAALGCHVETFARTAEAVDVFSGKMEAAGGSGSALVGDARDDAFLQEWVDRLVRQHGHIDVLIHNAGGGKRASVLDASLADWDWILDVNLRAAMVLTKLCLPHLLNSAHGAIISIASSAAKAGVSGSSAYAAAKAGLLHFSHNLFEELRDRRIKICAICPGYVDTPLIPSRKALRREEMIRPEDIAQTVAYILSLSPSACPVEIFIRPQINPMKT